MSETTGSGELEKEFTCWPSRLSEDKAKVVKATSRVEAARLARDIWKHEGHRIGHPFVVTVKDPEGREESFSINDRGEQSDSDSFH